MGTIKLDKSMREIKLEKEVEDLKTRLSLLEQRLDNIVQGIPVDPTVPYTSPPFSWPPLTIGDGIGSNNPYKIINNGTTITINDNTSSWTMSDWINANKPSSSLQQKNNLS